MRGFGSVVAFAIALAMSTVAGADALKEFTSDGCSLFPDGNFDNRTLWCDCCLEHDIAYWRGGTMQERFAADEKLRACVLRKTRNETLAQMMFAGVRLGGGPIFPNGYRWGYGWNYGRGYTPLSAAESKTADLLQEKYRASGKRFACGN